MTSDNFPEIARDANDFVDRIHEMNTVFSLPSPEKIVDHGRTRLSQFHNTIRDEFDELTAILEELELQSESLDQFARERPPLNTLLNKPHMVAFSDWLADIVVFCFSEAGRWGIPLVEVLHVVMDSQNSKLVDGKPIFDHQRKFLKGPNYVPPEPRIAEIVDRDYLGPYVNPLHD